MSSDSNSKFVPFVSADSIAAAENVRDFVQLCREEITTFGSDLNWDADIWDLTGYIVLRGRNHRVRAKWTNYDSAKSQRGVRMRQPFLDFAKAYFRYQYTLNPPKGFNLMRMMALRAVEKVLGEIADAPLIEYADASVFNRAAQLVKGKYSQGTSYCVGNELELFADFISKKRLTRMPFYWVNPLRPAATLNRIGKEFEAARKKKLPTDEAIYALANAYSIARDPRDVLITSVGALLCSAPSRICEVLTLPADCEYTNFSHDKEQYALRWWPAKGAEPMLKWVVGSMTAIAKDAIAKIRTVTEPWRRVAKWYEENRNQIYLPKEYAYLRERKEISRQEIGGLLGMRNMENVAYWLRVKKIKPLSHGSYAFRDFEKTIIKNLPVNFPILDRDTGLHYSEALLVVPRHFFHETHPVCPVMIKSVTCDAIEGGFGNRLKCGYHSVFARLDIVAASGDPIKIRTHQFRHFLNTVAQRGGASQLDIAMWSGRRDLGQNVAYDHVTSDELIARVRQDDGGSIKSGLVKRPMKSPVAKSDFDAAKTPAGHVTEYGRCTQNYAIEPCLRHLDCINCSRHVFVKGDHRMTERIKQALSQTQEMLAQNKQDLSDGAPGAGRWVEHQRKTEVRYRQAVEICEDPNVEEGAMFALTTNGEYSPMRVALEDHLKLRAPSSLDKPALTSSANAASLLSQLTAP